LLGSSELGEFEAVRPLGTCEKMVGNRLEKCGKMVGILGEKSKKVEEFCRNILEKHVVKSWERVGKKVEKS
jgi:hypothetical protein